MRVAIAIYGFLLAMVAGLAVVGGVLVLGRSGPDDPVARLADDRSFDFLSWELRHLPGKLLFEVGHLFDDGPSEEEQNEILDRYFQLVDTIETQERELAQHAAAGEDDADVRENLDRLRSERDSLENRVEDIIESRVTRLLEEEGLTTSLPLFDDFRFVFPPVDFELDSPPKVLVTSPRDRIELKDNFPLDAGLTLEDVLNLEDHADATGVSSRVFNIGGAATYPSIISELTDYPSLVRTVIHEWTHQYLFFFPLGRNFFRNDDTRTLNETVASMVDRELSNRLISRSIRPTPQQQGERAPGFDFAAEMRALRLKVEELLNQGRIEEAEQLMEAKRQEFAEKGVFIRKINQAFFAFRGFYADSPASINPIGPKLKALRERLDSVGEFMRTVARFTSVEDLDRALAGDGDQGAPILGAP